jgi:hypothetical protein
MEQIFTELAKLGLPGLFIGYLIWISVQKDNKYDRREAAFDAFHEARVAEGKENAKAMIEAAQALKQLSQGVEVAVETMAAATRAMVEATKEFSDAAEALERKRK